MKNKLERKEVMMKTRPKKLVLHQLYGYEEKNLLDIPVELLCHGNMDVEFLLPLQEEYLEVEGMRFSTYFEINNVLMVSLDHDYEELTKEAYARLLWTLEQNDQELNTPFYHIFQTEGAGRVTVLIGYAY